MKKWKKTPKHIMRESCVKYIIKNWTPSEFIEMGSGTGAMTRIFLERNYQGVCYDLGEENRNIIKENLSEFKNVLQVIDSFDEIPEQKQFAYLFAFEVLEHIENDLGALKKWSQFHQAGGKLLISVPAHMQKYSEEDEAVGHIRRYEKTELIKLLENSGYHHIQVLNYGFPLTNLTRIVSIQIQKKLAKDKSLSPEEKSIKSGVERVNIVNRIAFLFNAITLFPFLLLQPLFFNQDWGDGYVVCAEKK